MLGDEHDAAFTVAKMMDADLLLTVKGKLEAALAEGSTLQDFKKALIPELQKAGWWGKKDLVDPLTGQIVKSQLGSASRLETIFRSNIQSAYSVGHWDNIQATAKTAPFLMYDAVDDHRTRPEHAARDGEVHPVYSDFWKTHFPPNGWNCRCGVIQLDKDDLDEMGLVPIPTPKPVITRKWKNPRTGNVLDVPVDVDPGWDHNPGKARIAHLDELSDQKAQAMLAEERKAYKAAKQQQAIEQAKYEAQIAKDKEIARLQKKQDAATDAIAAALQSNTPYLAKELKTLQAAKPDANPLDLLAEAQVKALKAEQNSMIQTWKAAKKKGKPTSPKAQAYVDSLPQEVQDALQADVDKFLNKGQEAAAKELLDLALTTSTDPKVLLKQKILLEMPGNTDTVAALKELNEKFAEALVKIQTAAKAELKAIAEGTAAANATAKKQIFEKFGADGTASWLSDDVPALVALIEKEAQAIADVKYASSKLSGYKKKVLEGGIPTPAQQKVFNALDEPAKLKILADIDKKKAQQAAVQAAQEAPAPGPATYTSLDLDEAYEALWTATIKGTDVDTEWPSPAQFKGLKQNNDAFNVLGELEKLILDAGSTPNDAAAAWIASNKAGAPIAKGVTAAEVEAILAPKPGATINLDKLTQVGGQGGSNPGGTYLDNSTGLKWYIKEPKSLDNGRNEVLGAKFYEAAGIEVPEVFMIQQNGKDMIASKIIDGLESSKAKLTKGAPGAAEGFMMDAWLGNWDVVGLGFDNLLIKGGRAIRVDTGGSLRYRAQGGLKGDKWGNEVTELETLRNAKDNAQAAAVFGSLSREQLVESARRVATMTDDKIDDLLAKYGPLDEFERDKLAATLKARREYILAKFPEARGVPKPEPVPAGAFVTRIEQENITNSRSNGYAIPTDKDSIEDQQVLVFHKKTVDGEDATHGYLKIRGDAATNLTKELKDVGPAAAQAVDDYNDIHQTLIAAVKSVRYRVAEGRVLDSTAVGKVQATIERYEKIVALMTKEVAQNRRPQSQLDNFQGRLWPFIKELNNNQTVNATPTWSLTGNYTPFNVPVADALKEAAKPGQGRTWKAKKNGYAIANLDRGNAKESGERYGLGGQVYETKVGNATVTYWPDRDETMFALRGRLEVTVPGAAQASADDVFKVLQELGIDSTRATDLDMELLYLQQIAYANKLDTGAAFKKRMAARDVDGAKDVLSTSLGVDLKTSVHYKPMGEHQAFEHGRRTRFRPEVLSSPEWPAFERDYRLIHRVTNGSLEEAIQQVINGGGQMAPTTDKMRRGIRLGGMSPDSDLQSGGANYFFTRLAQKRSADRHHGIVWKARVAARVDAISYDSDNYGRTTGNHVKNHRKYTVDQMRDAAGNSSNETIIKDSLSIFDDIDHIGADSEAERKRIIDLFRKAGYREWPGDGRALEDVIVVRG